MGASNSKKAGSTASAAPAAASKGAAVVAPAAPAPVAVAVAAEAVPAPAAAAPDATPAPSSASESKTQTLHNPIVLCGPSGVGKGTLVGLLFLDWAEHFAKKISHTTRASRPDEVHGVHYYFTPKEQFEADIKESKFIEYALVHGNYYGTAVASVQTARESGKIVVLELDVQGVQQLQKITKETPDKGLPCTYIWIAPPDYDQLFMRLKQRGTDSEDGIKTRLETAQKERDMVEAMPEMFDYVLVNDNLNDCYHRFNEILAKVYPHLEPKIAAKFALIKELEGRNTPQVFLTRTPSEVLKAGPLDVAGSPAAGRAMKTGLTPSVNAQPAPARAPVEISLDTVPTSVPEAAESPVPAAAAAAAAEATSPESKIETPVEVNVEEPAAVSAASNSNPTSDSNSNPTIEAVAAEAEQTVVPAVIAEEPVAATEAATETKAEAEAETPAASAASEEAPVAAATETTSTSSSAEVAPAAAAAAAAEEAAPAAATDESV